MAKLNGKRSKSDTLCGISVGGWKSFQLLLCSSSVHIRNRTAILLKFFVKSSVNKKLNMRRLFKVHILCLLKDFATLENLVRLSMFLEKWTDLCYPCLCSELQNTDGAENGDGELPSSLARCLVTDNYTGPLPCTRYRERFRILYTAVSKFTWNCSFKFEKKNFENCITTDLDTDGLESWRSWLKNLVTLFL